MRPQLFTDWQLSFADEKRNSVKEDGATWTIAKVKVEGTSHVFVEEEISFEKKQLSGLFLREDKATRNQPSNFFTLISEIDLAIMFSPLLHERG